MISERRGRTKHIKCAGSSMRSENGTVRRSVKMDVKLSLTRIKVLQALSVGLHQRLKAQWRGELRGIFWQSAEIQRLIHFM